MKWKTKPIILNTLHWHCTAGTVQTHKLVKDEGIMWVIVMAFLTFMTKAISSRHNCHKYGLQISDYKPQNNSWERSHGAEHDPRETEVRVISLSFSFSLFRYSFCCRGKELDLYGVRPGSSTCVTKEIAAEVSGLSMTQAFFPSFILVIKILMIKASSLWR